MRRGILGLALAAAGFALSACVPPPPGAYQQSSLSYENGYAYDGQAAPYVAETAYVAPYSEPAPYYSEPYYADPYYSSGYYSPYPLIGTSIAYNYIHRGGRHRHRGDRHHRRDRREGRRHHRGDADDGLSRQERRELRSERRADRRAERRATGDVDQPRRRGNGNRGGSRQETTPARAREVLSHPKPVGYLNTEGDVRGPKIFRDSE